MMYRGEDRPPYPGLHESSVLISPVLIELMLPTSHGGYLGVSSSLTAFSAWAVAPASKRWGLCPSCAGWWLAQTAATSSRASSAECQRGHGWCQCLYYVCVVLDSRALHPPVSTPPRDVSR